MEDTGSKSGFRLGLGKAKKCSVQPVPLAATTGMVTAERTALINSRLKTRVGAVFVVNAVEQDSLPPPRVVRPPTPQGDRIKLA